MYTPPKFIEFQKIYYYMKTLHLKIYSNRTLGQLLNKKRKTVLVKRHFKIGYLTIK